MGVGVAGVVGTEPADHDVRRLDVPADQTTSVRLAERVTDLTQQEDRPLRIHSSEFPHQSLEAEIFEQFHHRVEVAFFRHSEIVDIDGGLTSPRADGSARGVRAAWTSSGVDGHG